MTKHGGIYICDARMNAMSQVDKALSITGVSYKKEGGCYL